VTPDAILQEAIQEAVGSQGVEVKDNLFQTMKDKYLQKKPGLVDASSPCVRKHLKRLIIEKVTMNKSTHPAVRTKFARGSASVVMLDKKGATALS
jgi:hypothetical protein